MIQCLGIAITSKLVKYKCKHFPDCPIPMLPQKFYSKLCKCSRFAALHLFCSNFNFGCSKRLVIRGFKLLHNQWVDAHLGVTTKQLWKMLLELCWRYCWHRQQIFYELPKLFWLSKSHIVEIPKPCSSRLSTFLSIGMLCLCNSFRLGKCAF